MRHFTKHAPPQSASAASIPARASEKIVGGYNKTHKGGPPGPAVPGRTRHKNSTRRAGLLTPASKPRCAVGVCGRRGVLGPRLLPVAGAPGFGSGCITTAVRPWSHSPLSPPTNQPTNQPTPTSHQIRSEYTKPTHCPPRVATPSPLVNQRAKGFRACGRRGRCR